MKDGSRGEDGHVLSLPQEDTFADFKGRVLPVQHRSGGPGKPQVGRPLEVRQGEYRLPGLDGVADVDHRHIGDRPHGGDVGNGLVAGSVVGVGQAAVRPAEADVQVIIGNEGLDGVQAAAGHEHGEGVHIGDKALQGQARRHVHHVQLADAHVEVPLRELLAKKNGPTGASHVGFQGHDPGVFRAKIPEGLAVCVADGDFLVHRIGPPSSAMARRYSSSPMGFPCQAL